MLSLVTVGCNHSRYGNTYDQRYPHVETVAVLPASFEMYSRHTGNVLERRTDLEPDLRRKTLSNIREIIRERGCKVEILDPPVLDQDDDVEAAWLALLSAVRDAIWTHHYEHGKAKQFSYDTGGDLNAVCATDADTVLMVYMTGVVPTSGRKFLKGTAVVVGLLTGIHVNVPTNHAVLQLMLVDKRNGDVLWFNHHEDEAHVGGEHRLRAFVERACAYLLKPRK